MSQVSCEQEKTLGLLQLSNTCILPRSCCSARMQAEEPASRAALTPIQSINSSSPAVFTLSLGPKTPGAPSGSRGDMYVWILGELKFF